MLVTLKSVLLLFGLHTQTHPYKSEKVALVVSEVEMSSSCFARELSLPSFYSCRRAALLRCSLLPLPPRFQAWARPPSCYLVV